MQLFSTLHSALYKQVSHLLTNHLSRAMDRLVVSEGGASESLQDALSLLLGLAKSQMGRAILSQPACVSKLLLLLTDQRQVICITTVGCMYDVNTVVHVHVTEDYMYVALHYQECMNSTPDIMCSCSLGQPRELSSLL